MNRFNFIIIVALFLLGITSCKKEETSPSVGHSDAIFNPNLKYGVLTDIDGNKYKTIKVGNQEWMAQNLRVTHYRNGDPIPLDSTSNWDDLKEGRYCMANNDTNIDTIATYGLLYNGYVVLDKRNVAPEGWRIPTKEDVNILYKYLESLETPEDLIREGGRMKETGTKHWNSPNIASNSSGLTFLPNVIRGDYRYIDRGRTLSTLFTQTNRIDHPDFEQLESYGAISITDIPLTRGCPSYTFGLPLRCVKINK